ncbi:hypothetical protein [uncultured Mailhella sp.]|uniref:hypothetical protein n=1 Tax=uncultured Mailhella sp. TaxID=1981031 RepID=UPI0025DC5291|nr:hypothetical protein [uncultured Mailhella sp.]
MLVVWLVLVVILSIVVARSTNSASSGNLLAFLFTRVENTVLMPVLPAVSTPAPAPAPEPAAEPQVPAEPQPAPQEWLPLSEGKTAGKGVLSRPELRTLDDGSLELTLSCDGTPGDFSLYRPTNVPALSVDLQGAWGSHVSLDQKIAESCLYRIQIATHPTWMRISGIARDNNAPLSAKVEYSSRAGKIRIVFSSGS